MWDIPRLLAVAVLAVSGCVVLYLLGLEEEYTLPPPTPTNEEIILWWQHQILWDAFHNDGVFVRDLVQIGSPDMREPKATWSISIMNAHDDAFGNVVQYEWQPGDEYPALYSLGADGWPGGEGRDADLYAKDWSDEAARVQAWIEEGGVFPTYPER